MYSVAQMGGGVPRVFRLQLLYLLYIYVLSSSSLYIMSDGKLIMHTPECTLYSSIIQKLEKHREKGLKKSSSAVQKKAAAGKKVGEKKLQQRGKEKKHAARHSQK